MALSAMDFLDDAVGWPAGVTPRVVKMVVISMIASTHINMVSIVFLYLRQLRIFRSCYNWCVFMKCLLSNP